jgi:hypothetical protein
MTQFLNKYVRKFHRWLVLPFIVILLTLLFMKGTPVGSIAQRAQQVMMLTLALSGAYLFLLPYLTKWRRRRQRTARERDAGNNPAGRSEVLSEALERAAE